MASRPGLIGRLVGRVRGGQPTLSVQHTPAPLTPAFSAADELIDRHLAEASAAMRAGSFQEWMARPEPTPRGLAMSADPALQIACLRVARDRLADAFRRSAGSPGAGTWASGNRGTPSYSVEETHAYLLWLVVSNLVYRKLPYTHTDVAHLLDRAAAIVAAFPARQPPPLRGLEFLCLRELLTGIVKWAASHGVGTDIRAAAQRLRDAVMGTAAGDRLPQDERGKLHVLLVDLLDDGGPEGYLNDRDAWGGLMREALTRMEPAERTAWRRLFEQAGTANNARPKATWLQRAADRIAALGEDAFARDVVTWLDFYAAPPRRGDNVAPPELSSMAERNVTVLRGLIWSCANCDGAGIARAVGDATEASFKKITGVGPRSLKLGNAGIYALGAMPGMHAVEQLARL